ncbi:MAG: ABC transporter permease [Acidimicrobiales bacterium]|jgi:peptide/nickel transport system permease protein
MTTATATALPLFEPAQEVAGRPSFWSRALHSPTFMAGAVITATIVALVVLSPVIGRYSPDALDPLHPLSGPSALHWLGTDELGRDTWSRVLYGGRTDLQVGVLAVIFPFCFGVFIGTVCGYFGGRLDTIVMRVVDVVLAFPFYVLIIALVFAVGVGTHGIYIAFGLTDWVVYARTTRSATLLARNLDWVAAAQGGGLSRARVLWRHILPNTITQAIVYSMSDIVIVILAVVALGYLGLGIQPPAPDWGSMIYDGQNFLQNDQWMAVFPGIAVVFTGIGLSLLGDGLADVLRPE